MAFYLETGGEEKVGTRRVIAAFTRRQIEISDIGTAKKGRRLLFFFFLFIFSAFLIALCVRAESGGFNNAVMGRRRRRWREVRPPRRGGTLASLTLSLEM